MYINHSVSYKKSFCPIATDKQFIRVFGQKAENSIKKTAEKIANF